jgi:hypothetical protein
MQSMAREALLRQIGVHSLQPKIPGAARFGGPVHGALAGRELVARLLDAGDMVLQPREQGFGVQLFLRLALEHGNWQLGRSGQAAISRTLAG